MRDRALAAFVATLALGTPAAGKDYLPAALAVAALADGRSWTGQRPGGASVRLTLRRDGSGRFEGPLTRETRWTVQGEAI